MRRVLPALVALGALGAIVVAVALFASGRNDPGDSLVETGVVVEVDAASLTEVLGFTVRTADGRTVEFLVGPLENPAEFPPSHLSAHLASGEPIRVTFKQAGSDRVAYRLEDAPRSS